MVSGLVLIIGTASARAAEISTQECLANLNADLKQAVAASEQNAKISDFKRSDVWGDGSSQYSTYVFTRTTSQGAIQAVGQVELTQECKIAGSEKFLGLNFVIVGAPLM